MHKELRLRETAESLEDKLVRLPAHCLQERDRKDSSNDYDLLQRVDRFYFMTLCPSPCLTRNGSGRRVNFESLSKEHDVNM